MSKNGGVPSRLDAAVRIADSRNAVARGAIGMAAVSAALIFVYDHFGARVDPRVFVPWFIAMAFCPLAFAVLSIFYVFRQPDDAELARFWMPSERALRPLLDLATAGGIWILLPLAEPSLSPVMIMLYVWFIATRIMSTGELGAWNWLGSIGVSVSLIAFVLYRDAPYALPLATFLGLTATTLITLGRVIDRTNLRLIAAQLETERANAALRDALVTVAADRDGKTRFIAAASHDLLQPLQAAKLFFEHAITSQEPKLRAQAIDGTRNALASTQDLVGHMLDHLRLEAGVVVARPEALALGPLVANLAAERTPTAQAAGMRLIAVPSRHRVLADPALLRRAMGNLIDNAVRHAGGKRVLVGARRSGGTVTIWVVDDGTGIAAADIDRLFDDFTQGSDHGALTRGGFGLGLAIVRRSAAMMAGTTGLDRRWTAGAAFYLALPAASDTAMAAAPLFKAA